MIKKNNPAFWFVLVTQELEEDGKLRGRKLDKGTEGRKCFNWFWESSWKLKG